jgi:hypothetical protein
MIWSRLWSEDNPPTSSVLPIPWQLKRLLETVIRRSWDEGASFEGCTAYRAICNAITNVQSAHSIGPNYYRHTFILWISLFDKNSILHYTLIHAHLPYNLELGFWERLYSLLEGTCDHVEMWKSNSVAFRCFLLFLQEVTNQSPLRPDPSNSERLITAITTLFKSMVAFDAIRFESGYSAPAYANLILLLTASLPSAILFRATLSTLWEWHAQHTVDESRWTALDALFRGEDSLPDREIRSAFYRNWGMSYITEAYSLIDIPS